MIIPDYISPVVAYRTWQWDSLGLKSLNNEQWFPGHCLAAVCRRYEGWQVADDKAAPIDGHELPHDGCSCGVYAAKNFAHLRNIGYANFGVHGEVYLWGKVVEHRFGYRAQYAYPKSIVLPPDTIPFKMSQAESHLEPLMAYGVDIAVASTSISALTPLWSKRSGYDRAGLDFLIEKRKRWYLRRAAERRLKRNDRVAVLGEGIGVVTCADSSEVHLLVWNKALLRLSRKQVAWNEENWRWEADATAILARRTLGVPAAASAAAG